MIALVTGAGGFVGQNIIPYLLSNGIDTIASYRNGENSLQDFVKEGKMDDCKINTVIHLAGKAHDLKNVSKPEEYHQVNTVLSGQIFDAFLASDAKLFVMLSSVKAVRDTLHEETLTEELVPEPGTVYGKTKLQAEEYILSQPIPEGKRVYILRPCMIHGPGNKGNLNLLFKVAKLGIPYPLASFENQRSFLSIENLCFVIRELLERTDIPSGIYNVADDTPLSTNRVIQIMCETILKRPRLWRINKRCIKGITRVGDFLSLPLNSERLQKLTESYVVSNAKLLTSLNKPLPVSSEEGLRKTIQSFMKG
ncbi:MAG TPA: NAD-dependent epimerase/dehydratase family protein [Sediminibacterium sp.]